MRIGTTELLVVLIIVVLVFGPKNLPKLAKMFGKASKNFKEGMEEDDDEEEVKPKKKTKKAETEDDDSED